MQQGMGSSRGGGTPYAARVNEKRRIILQLFSSALNRLRSDDGKLISVLALWAVMLSAALVCIAKYGVNLPLAEEWDMVPPLVGREPNLLEWLWAQRNEHRLPLHKAIYLALLKTGGGDFRIGMVANAMILGGVSLAMILAARLWD
jgi:hypothetical protein